MVPFSKAVRRGYRSNPVDRGKPGSKTHVLSDHTGVPLTVLISAANVHDSQLMVPLLDSIARSVLLVAGRGTGQASGTRTRRTTSERYAPRSAAAASECALPARASSPRRVRARHRWIAEGCLSWLMNNRRLVPPGDRDALRRSAETLEAPDDVLADLDEPARMRHLPHRHRDLGRARPRAGRVGTQTGAAG
jgi:hypothetical protein